MDGNGRHRDSGNLIYGNPAAWSPEIRIPKVEIRKNSEIQNLKYCLLYVPLWPVADAFTGFLAVPRVA